MEHLAAMLKALAPEKTVGARHASPLQRERAIRATRSVGATHASPSYQRQRCRKGRGSCLAPTKQRNAGSGDDTVCSERLDLGLGVASLGQHAPGIGAVARRESELAGS